MRCGCVLQDEPLVLPAKVPNLLVNGTQVSAAAVMSLEVIDLEDDGCGGGGGVGGSWAGK